MKGRKPVPDSIRILRGQKPRGPSAAKVATGAPEMPEGLSEAAAAEWDRLAPLLHRAGLLATIDGNVLGLYCSAVADWRAAREKVEELGPVVRSPAGFPQVSPYVSLARNAAKAMQSLGSELGLSPVARQRIGPVLDPDHKDDFDEFREWQKRASG
jgi:P27 family predicted phage terminase small subunit